MRKFFFVLFFSLAAAGIAAQDQIRETELEQMVVTGARFEQSPLFSPAPVFVIDRAQIRQSGARRLADLLQGQAGIQVRDGIGDGGRGIIVAMRGFGENAANNTLVLVDGRRLNNPTLQPPDLNSVALKDVERVEILAGSAGVLFGEQAVGGVINVITREAAADSAHIEAGMGSDGLRQYQASYSGDFDNGVGLRLSAQKRDSDNYRDNNRSDYTNFMGRLRYRWKSGSVFAEYHHIDDQLRVPGALPVELAAQDRRQSVLPNDFVDLETKTWRAGASLQFAEHWRLIGETSGRKSDGKGFQFAPNSSDMEVLTFNPRLVGEFPVSAGTAYLTAGIDLTHSDYVLDIPDFFFRTDFTQELQDAYAQLVYPLAERLSVTAGLRRSTIDDKDKSAGRDGSDAETLGTLGLSWHFSDTMRLLVRRDDTLRYANVDENGFTLPAVSFLQPQLGESWELGFEWFSTAFGVQAIAYRLDLEDEILYDPTAPGPGADFGFFGANINLDSSRRQGLAVSGQWTPTESWRLAASYTWTHAEILSGSFRDRQVPYVAEHSASVSAGFQVNSNLTLYAEAIYTGERYSLGDDVNSGPKVDDYLLLNASARLDLGRWSAALRINNIVEEKYETLSTLSFGSTSIYPAPERTWVATLSYSL